MAEWLRRLSLRAMKCTVDDLEAVGSNPCQVELGVRHIPSKLYLNQSMITYTLLDALANAAQAYIYSSWHISVRLCGFLQMAKLDAIGHPGIETQSFLIDRNYVLH